jgi:hypothetical protein
LNYVEFKLRSGAKSSHNHPKIPFFLNLSGIISHNFPRIFPSCPIIVGNLPCHGTSSPATQQPTSSGLQRSFQLLQIFEVILQNLVVEIGPLLDGWYPHGDYPVIIPHDKNHH